MRRTASIALLFLALASWAMSPSYMAGFPIDYSDPSSDVVRLNSTTGLCEIDAGSNCITSPTPHDVNIQWLRGRETGLGNMAFNLTIQVQGRIADLANTSYIVHLYADATNRTHWVVNYTNGVLLLYTNLTGASRTDISGNATVWGLNPTLPNSVSMVVDKDLLGGPSNISASADIDATAIMQGNPVLAQPYSFQDFGWEVPGHPATSPTVLNGHVYVGGTTTPIAGATVTLESGQSVLTDGTGYYQFSLSPAAYDVSVSAGGYTTVTFSVVLTTGQTLTRDVELARSPQGVLQDLLIPILIVVGVLAALVILLALSRRRRTDT